jgi:hypothetical protein
MLFRLKHIVSFLASLLKKTLPCNYVTYNKQYQYITLIMNYFLLTLIRLICRSQWPRGLRRSSAAARLLRSWIRIPPGAWMCCLL